jgi:hypothetical protein
MATRRFNRAKVFWTRCVQQNKMKVSAPVDLAARWMVEHNGGYLVLKPGTSFLNTGFKKYYNIFMLPDRVNQHVQPQKYWYDRCVKNQTILPASIKTDQGYMNFTVEGNRLVFNRAQRIPREEFTQKLKELRSYEGAALARMPGVVAVKVLPQFDLLPELSNLYCLDTFDKRFRTATKLSMSMPNLNDEIMLSTRDETENRHELLQDSAELPYLLAKNCMDFTLGHDCVFYILKKDEKKFVIHKISKHSADRPRATLHNICLWGAKHYSLLYSMQLEHLLALVRKLDDYLSTPDKTQTRQHVVTRTFELNSEIKESDEFYSAHSNLSE